MWNLLLEGKAAILVRVEELDETVGLALRDSEVALISEEVEDLEGADEGVAVSVKSLEGRVGGEVSDGAESLASGLKTSLSVADSNEQIFKSALRFKTKAHSCSTIVTVQRQVRFMFLWTEISQDS